MKMWWMVAVSLAIVAATGRQTVATEQQIKGEDGQVLATLVQCNWCQSSSGQPKKSCHDGAEKGWLNGQPCGECLIKSNANTPLRYPFDLHISGTITDPDGQPVKERYVKVFMSNGWSVRTRTSDQGTFRLMLGATAERKSRKPVITELGTLVDAQKGKDTQYAIYLLPPAYEPCAASPAAPAKPAKGKKKS